MAPSLPAYEPEGCPYIRPSRVAYTGLRRALRHIRPEVDKDRVVNLWKCVRTRKKAHVAHARAMRWWAWRHREPHRSWIRFHRLDPYWQQWARRVTACESGWNRYASNGTHHSFYQWLPATYAAAGGTGSPYSLSWPQQTLLAVSWAQRVGQSQWTCS